MESGMREFVNTYDENGHWKQEFPQRVKKRRTRSHSSDEADGVTLPCRGYPLWQRRNATIKRQKVPTRRRSFRSPLLSTLLLQRARSIEPQKRSAEARVRRRFCASRTMVRAAQLRSDVLTVFPNTPTLLRGGRERPRASLMGYD